MNTKGTSRVRNTFHLNCQLWLISSGSLENSFEAASGLSERMLSSMPSVYLGSRRSWVASRPHFRWPSTSFRYRKGIGSMPQHTWHWKHCRTSTELSRELSMWLKLGTDFKSWNTMLLLFLSLTMIFEPNLTDNNWNASGMSMQFCPGVH